MSTETIDTFWETDNTLTSEEIVSSRRNTGLNVGEMDAEVLADTAMNPETRNIIKVTIEDAQEVADAMNAWMGDDIESRKKFISENINEYAKEVD